MSEFANEFSPVCTRAFATDTTLREAGETFLQDILEIDGIARVLQAIPQLSEAALRELTDVIAANVVSGP